MNSAKTIYLDDDSLFIHIEGNVRVPYDQFLFKMFNYAFILERKQMNFCLQSLCLKLT